MFKIDPIQSMMCYTDASFAGDWNQSWSEESSSVFSRTGYVIIIEDAQFHCIQNYNLKYH